MSSSPLHEETRSQSPVHPGMGRAVTAPDLAAALERTQRVRIRLPTFQPSSSAGHVSDTPSKDDLNDLGKDVSGLQTPVEGTSSVSFFETNTPRRGLPTPKAWQTYFMQEVAGDKYLEFQLLLMTISTGMLDAMTYTTYKVFASKQTGNTLFLALYAFRLPALDPGIEQNVGMSIGAFILGAIFFGHIGHLTRQRRRIWLLASNAFQAILMLAAAAIRYWVSRKTTGHGPLAILALLAFAESGQIANALNVAMPELNTTMITGALIQLCTDKKFFKLKNVKRNRRLAFFSSMLLGCFIGAAILRYSSPSAALVVTAASKGLLFFLFFLNRGMVERKVTVEDGTGRVEGCVTPVSRVLWGD